MSIRLADLPPPDERGYEVAQDAGVLRVTIKRDFDRIRSAHTWAALLGRACVGPFERVEVDVSLQVMLSSTLIAGLVHIRDCFGSDNTEVALVGANDRVLRSLEMMKLHTLFSFREA